MKQNEVFKNAIWIGATEQDISPYFMRNFDVKCNLTNAEITILGYGTFIFFINGKKGTDDMYLPIVSDFEERDYPKGEKLRHRAYVYKYNITNLLHCGENALSVLLSNSWYTGWYNGNFSEKSYGSSKLCYLLKLEYENNDIDYVFSSTLDKYMPSFITNSLITGLEVHDYSDWKNEYFSVNSYDSSFKSAVAVKEPETDYYFSSCPPDRIKEEIIPKFLKKTKDGGMLYDVGKNISGFPVIECKEKSCSVIVTFSEEITDDFELDESHAHSQLFEIKNDGKKRQVQAETVWFAFRYFKVIGDAEPLKVYFVHADVSVSSSFESSCDTLNWIYETYKNTQNCNMHFGIPSDCPHLERRGYTGDGQLTCRAAMRAFDMKEFYAKWIEDISDCQDELSGHVQYTAPYTHSGGGPGGWGCAIVILPYEYYKYYGDDSFSRKMYPQMLKYFEYLESHSDNMLVSRDNDGEWCLGEWCTPGPVALPAPFINNYFYIKSMMYVKELAQLFGYKEDALMLENRIIQRKRATQNAYMNSWDGNFIGNIQGANAFALDIGIGDARTKNNFINYYEDLGHYDTGIFGTDIVTRLLFEYGREDISYRLLTASDPFGFGKWKNDDVTTFWEYWYNARSHNHPMFGAVCGYLFDYILGIKQPEDGFGYKKIIISPKLPKEMSWAKGHIQTPLGKIFVNINSNGEKNKLTIISPKDMDVEIICDADTIVEHHKD